MADNKPSLSEIFNKSNPKPEGSGKPSLDSIFNKHSSKPVPPKYLDYFNIDEMQKYFGEPDDDNLNEQLRAGLTEGVLNVPNLIQAPVGVPWWIARQAGVPLPEMRALSEVGKDLLKNVGYDLYQNQPKTGLGKALREGASWAVPTGTAGKALTTAGNFINKYSTKAAKYLSGIGNLVGKQDLLSKESIRGMKTGALAGSAIGATKHAVGPEKEGYVDLLGGLTFPYMINKGSTAFRKGVTKSAAESRLQDYVRNKIGEENIPDVVANIERNNVPENFVEGYKPTTAEVAENGMLAAEERNLMGLNTSPEYGKISQRTIEQNEAILNKIEGMVPENYTAEMAKEYVQEQHNRLSDALYRAEEFGGKEAADAILENFLNRGTPQEAGRQVQRRVGNDILEPMIEARREQGGKDYDVIGSSNQRQNPIEARQVINDRKRNAKGKLRDFFTKAERNLESNDNEFIDVNGEIQRVPPRIGELEGLKQSLDHEATKVKPRSPKHAHITAIQKALDRDLANFPEVQTARSNYKELSKPMSPITEHPVIKGDIAKNRFGDFIRNPANVIEKYIKGDKSVEYAKDLLPYLQGDKSAMDAVAGNINSLFVKKVIGDNGVANINKLNNFKKEYPGAFILDPKLETKLANTTNATNAYNNMVRESQTSLRNFERSAASKFLNSDADRVAADIIGSRNSVAMMKDAVELLRQDPSKSALPGFQRSMAEHIIKNFKTLGEDNTNISINKFNKLWLNKEKALSELFDPEQMKALELVHNTLLSRNRKYTLAKEIGSPTAPKTQNLLNLGLSKLGALGKKIPGGNTTYDFALHALDKLSEIKNKKFNEYLVKFVVEPEYAKLLLTDVHGKNNAEINKMISNYNKQSAIKAIQRASTNRTNEEEE